MTNPDLPFHFKEYRFDDETGVLSLRYYYADGPEFEETITFPKSSKPLSEAQRQALDKAFRLLFLIKGVSYYKAFAPTELKCDAFDLDKDTAAFVREIYLKGLAEFAYNNKLDLSKRLKFEIKDAKAPTAVALPNLQGALVPVGGGKDSVVSIEMLKRVGMPLRLFVFSSSAQLPSPIQGCIDVSGLDATIVIRKISPTLLELNQKGAYNGHIPITAILSLVATCAAIISGQKYIVLSNERSASAPNTMHGDLEVNHQYSKSFEFETRLAQMIEKTISPDLVYFSLLRPLSEVAIAQIFAKATAYHSVFRSCNTAFRQDVAARGTKWCCDCPKCRFVFLALAPFVAEGPLVSIFGKNMLDDETQTQGFEELCGLSAFKPFECVGEIEESALLMAKLAQMPEWQNDKIVKQLAPQLAFDEGAYKHLFEQSLEHNIPEEFKGLLDAST